MSQWTNRFSVLKEEELSNIPPSNSPKTEDRIMSEPVLPSPYTPQKVYIRSTKIRFSTKIHAQIKTLDTGVTLDLDALLDSGATGLFLDTQFVRGNNLNTRKLPRAIPVYNVDGTLNRGGSINEEVDVILTYKDHTEKATFAVCDLGDKVGIIGHTWLHSHNPEINWQTGEIKLSRCPPKCQVRKQESRSRKKVERKGTGRLLPLLPEEEDAGMEQDKDEDDQSPEQEIEDGDRVVGAFLHPAHEVNAAQTTTCRADQQALGKENF